MNHLQIKHNFQMLKVLQFFNYLKYLDLKTLIIPNYLTSFFIYLLLNQESITIISSRHLQQLFLLQKCCQNIFQELMCIFLTEYSLKESNEYHLFMNLFHHLFLFFLLYLSFHHLFYLVCLKIDGNQLTLFLYQFIYQSYKNYALLDYHFIK